MSPAATGPDRLPWLSDDHPAEGGKSRSARSAGVLPWLAGAVLLFALGSGAAIVARRPHKEPQTLTVQLPAVRPVATGKSIAEPHALAESAATPARNPPAGERISPSKSAEPVAPSARRAQSAPPPKPATPAGRAVEIGAFGSPAQAEAGRQAALRAYPGMAGLPARVSPAHNSRGVLYYRFRFGTTSQAHSEVLCQRMQKIQLSCAVLGLPAAASR